MNEPNNIDAALVSDMNKQAPVQPAAQPVVQAAPEPEVKTQSDPEQSSDPYGANQNEEVGETKEQNVPRRTSEPEPEKASDNPIDEYGNPVEKPRVYTEEEVNKMFRERMARGRHQDAQPQGQQPFQQQPQQPHPQNNQQPDGENWESELKHYIKSTLDEVKNEENERYWQAQEQQRQQEFQEKFTSGMTKYKDFQEVVRDKPITNGIMLGARNLENPAAFIYAAAKMHPKEIERIANIPDGYAQAAEVGRLHERMVKESKRISQAAKPLNPPTGEMPRAKNEQPSLESRIEAYGRQKQKR